MDLGGLKYLIVGSGFFGSVLAERIAGELKEKVLVIEKRDHVGGNCFSLCNAGDTENTAAGSFRKSLQEDYRTMGPCS